ncbi:MAG: hypothetical protein OR997_03920 [Methylophilaceae bacterium]|nr:hypothetical protein [Methylophilaceae bacterium]
MHKIFQKAVLSTFLTFIFFSGNAQALCDISEGKLVTAVSDSANSVKDGGTDSDTCSSTPDAYELTFYKLGVCKTDPSGGDLRSCTFILNTTAGLRHAVAFPAEGALDVGPISIPVGDYPYQVAILSNKIGIKHSTETTNDVTGVTGEGKFCWTSNAGPTGVTNEGSIDTPHGKTVTAGSQMIECGTKAGTAVFSYEVINTMGTKCKGAGSGFSAEGGKTDASAPGGVQAWGSLLKSDGKTWATTCGNAAKILWTTKTPKPLAVTASSTFVMNFKTVGSVSIDFSSNPGDNKIEKMGADPIEGYLSTN